MKRIIFIGLILVLISFGYVQADSPKISNLQFSANPVTVGEVFTISIEFEGDVDGLLIENIWETKDGKIKQELKEFAIPSDVKEKQKGVLTRQWKVASGAHKPYRILKIWVKDSNGNQSNILSGELKLAKTAPMVLGEKCEAPVWNVGDEWTYKEAGGGTWGVEVKDVTEDLYIVKYSKGLYAYDKKTLNVKYSIEDGGRRIKFTEARRKLFDFPILIGKNWRDRSTLPIGGIEVDFLNEFKIEGVDEVATSAGTFNAYRIFWKQTNMYVFGSGWVRFWYSPEVKIWIKREFEKSSFWAPIYKDTELISFKLK